MKFYCGVVRTKVPREETRILFAIAYCEEGMNGRGEAKE
jgi:hypothetical protein